MLAALRATHPNPPCTSSPPAQIVLGQTTESFSWHPASICEPTHCFSLVLAGEGAGAGGAHTIDLAAGSQVERAIVVEGLAALCARATVVWPGRVQGGEGEAWQV